MILRNIDLTAGEISVELQVGWRGRSIRRGDEALPGRDQQGTGHYSNSRFREKNHNIEITASDEQEDVIRLDCFGQVLRIRLEQVQNGGILQRYEDFQAAV